MKRITIKKITWINSLKYEKEIIELDKITLGKLSKKFIFLKGLRLRKLPTNIQCDEKTRQAFSFFAATENNVVGFIIASVFLKNKKKIYIQKLGVHPDFQKKGIAKKIN